MKLTSGVSISKKIVATISWILWNYVDLVDHLEIDGWQFDRMSRRTGVISRICNMGIVCCNEVVTVPT